MLRNWMVAGMLAASWLVGCADEPPSGYDAVEAAEPDVADDVVVESRTQAIIFGDAPGPVGCRADCMDVCNQDGEHTAACRKSCQKACTAAGPIAPGGGGANQVCLAGNKVWQGICEVTPPLQAACFFSGGCSGCRKKMDKNC